MSLDKPRVTVLMPVYNGEKYLREAMDSILTQTFTDFEFLIINDGSTDRSVEIIVSYNDTRIRLVHNENNLKLVATLNKGLDLARGEYIARMDCDDISLPERLARQVAFMEAHPELGICGTWAKKIDSDGKVLGDFKSPVGEQMDKYIWRPTPIIHPTAVFRNSVIKSFRYDQNFTDAEDLELWQRVSKVTKLDNLNEYLFLYRVHPQSVTALKRAVQLRSVYKAFVKLYGSDDISYEEFLAVLYESNKLSPIERANIYSRISSKFQTGFVDFMISNLKYLVYWVYPNIKKPR